eukprot:comp22214_c0_seq1/m.52501 comp22214_c0_seq1/g.52501  ORF comp22214_c0_seq1/g.52501 comp22214_c0_seq1/m.52501 type:complete len:396 (+) comp22214_c0_seq1:2866-4053(+)
MALLAHCSNLCIVCGIGLALCSLLVLIVGSSALVLLGLHARLVLFLFCLLDILLVLAHILLEPIDISGILVGIDLLALFLVGGLGGLAFGLCCRCNRLVGLFAFLVRKGLFRIGLGFLALGLGTGLLFLCSGIGFLLVGIAAVLLGLIATLLLDIGLLFCLRFVGCEIFLFLFLARDFILDVRKLVCILCLVLCRVLCKLFRGVFLSICLVCLFSQCITACLVLIFLNSSLCCLFVRVIFFLFGLFDLLFSILCGCFVLIDFLLFSFDFSIEFLNVSFGFFLITAKFPGFLFLSTRISKIFPFLTFQRIRLFLLAFAFVHSVLFCFVCFLFLFIFLFSVFFGLFSVFLCFFFLIFRFFRIFGCFFRLCFSFIFCFFCFKTIIRNFLLFLFRHPLI